jgi:outer membrane protein TolC
MRISFRHCAIGFAAFAFAFSVQPRTAAQSTESGAPIQLVQPQGPGAPPVVITLQDALDRAKTNDAQFQLAIADAQIAREDRVQAKSSLLPALSQNTAYLGTQGNGLLPSGRFVTNDGVHVYRSWGVLHQELSANTVLLTGYRRSQAVEALARAKVEIAQRGLAVTVTRNYYALVIAQRKYATAQQSVQQAMRFFDISQQAERAGQVAHSDVVKAELQYQQQKQNLDEATLAMENARLSLAVLIFPMFNENFTVVDDLDAAQTLPPFPEIQTMAARENPELRVAQEALRQATLDVRGARNAFLPTLVVDAVYGIEANAFALHSTVAAFPEFGPLPNLGYFITGTVTFPLWDWGTLRSKVRQAQTRTQQAQVELTQTQRQLIGNLYSFYNEALVARSAVDSLRHTADLAAESLRLINLRYQAGESTALEVVDAQNTFLQMRNAYDDAQARYRLALATLQTLTGNF